MHATLLYTASHTETWGTASSMRDSAASVYVNAKTKNVSENLRTGLR